MNVSDGISILSTAGLSPPAMIPDGGSPPQLRWIDIDALYVDLSYQREVLRRGRRNIERIASEFDWAFFAPVIVSPREGGDFYCIIDGQHRCAAAKLIGKTSVPCAIVIADVEKQAAAFRAVNANVTRMHPNHIHRAALRAGDPDAVELDAIVAEGGARILASPTPISKMKAGDTQAIATLRQCVGRYGREVLVRALLALTQTPRDYRGMIGDGFLQALCRAIEPMDVTRDEVKSLFAKIDLKGVDRTARNARVRSGGKLADHLDTALERVLGLYTRVTPASRPPAPAAKESAPLARAPAPVLSETPAPSQTLPAIRVSPAAQALTDFQNSKLARAARNPNARIVDHTVDEPPVVALGEPAFHRSALFQRQAEQERERQRKEAKQK